MECRAILQGRCLKIVDIGQTSEHEHLQKTGAVQTADLGLVVVESESPITHLHCSTGFMCQKLDIVTNPTIELTPAVIREGYDEEELLLWGYRLHCQTQTQSP